MALLLKGPDVQPSRLIAVESPVSKLLVADLDI